MKKLKQKKQEYKSKQTCFDFFKNAKLNNNQIITINGNEFGLYSGDYMPEKEWCQLSYVVFWSYAKKQVLLAEYSMKSKQCQFYQTVKKMDVNGKNGELAFLYITENTNTYNNLPEIVNPQTLKIIK